MIYSLNNCISVILLSKLTMPRLSIHDMSDDEDENRRKEINGKLVLTWNDFCLFISRFSTPNFIQGARKVQEFTQGQITSGSETLSSFFDVQKTLLLFTMYPPTRNIKGTASLLNIKSFLNQSKL